MVVNVISSFNAEASSLIVKKGFYYVRHAESTHNRDGIIAGSIDVPITAEGAFEAEEAAKHTAILMKDVKIIVASPLIRTRQTAEIFAKYLNVPIIYDEGLQELCLGPWECKDKHSKAWKKMWGIWLSGGDPGGVETMHKFHKRIINTVNNILSKHDHILIVGHGAFFGNMTDVMDIGYMNIPNAVPYKLIPPRDQNDSWKVQNLYEIGE